MENLNVLYEADEDRMMRIESIRLELDLYRNAYSIEQRIQEELHALYDDIGPGVTNYDYELGRMSMSSPSAEQQALSILYREEKLNATLNSLNKRVERVKQAIGLLDYESKKIITVAILNDLRMGYSDREIEEALLCLHEKWNGVRKLCFKKCMEERKQKTMEKAKKLRKLMKISNFL